MSHRYKIRAFESGDQDGVVDAGTIVVPIERTFSLFARTVDEAERKLQEDVLADKLPKGRIYQICPPFGNPESIRAFAVNTTGECTRVFLDPASGIYSEFRRLRYKDLRVNAQRDTVVELQKALT
jgi:hypothetical protein